MGRSRRNSRTRRRALQQANVTTLPTWSTFSHILAQLDHVIDTHRDPMVRFAARRQRIRTLRAMPGVDAVSSAKKAHRMERTRALKLYRPTVTDTRPTRAKLAAAGAVTVAQRASVCVGRSQRKEIMFATNKAGRVGQKSPVWTKKSKVRC